MPVDQFAAINMSSSKRSLRSSDCVSKSSKRPKLEPEPTKKVKHGNSSKPPVPDNIAQRLLDIEGAMSRDLGGIDFGPTITHIYNPLDYASNTHSQYVRCYGDSVKRILFLGMNPGPFGMAQNGVSLRVP